MAPSVDDRHRGSATRYWPVLAPLHSLDNNFAAWAARNGRLGVFLYEFIRFGVKQAWACLFGGLMLALIIATYFFYPSSAALYRYDFLTLCALVIQLALILTRMETLDEAKVILIFHVVGTVMEIFKTAKGSWVYPEAAWLRIAGVPLFTGFMYACVGSYMARAWRLFDFRFTGHPPRWAIFLLSAAIYVNFFTHHYVADIRYLLFAGCIVVFGPAWIYYRIHTRYRRMPVLLSALLVAFFIWVAENVGTLTHTWTYPGQAAAWTMVAPAKMGSWFLLIVISYGLVTLVNRPQPYTPAQPLAESARQAIASPGTRIVSGADSLFSPARRENNSAAICIAGNSPDHHRSRCIGACGRS